MRIRTAKRDDALRRLEGAAVLHGGSLTAFELVRDAQTVHLAEQW